MKYLKWAAVVLIAIAVSVGLHVGITGYLHAQNPETAAVSGTAFSAPQIVIDRFGDDVASYFPAVVLSICTLVGVVASVFWQHFTDGAKLTWRSFAPIVVSPIVLYVTYAAAKDHPDGFIASLMAFENGFFWNVVLASRGRSAGG